MAIKSILMATETDAVSTQATTRIGSGRLNHPGRLGERSSCRHGHQDASGESLSDHRGHPDAKL